MIVEIPDDDVITFLAGDLRPTLIGILAIEIGSASRAQELLALGLDRAVLAGVIGGAIQTWTPAHADDPADYLADIVRHWLLAGAR